MSEVVVIDYADLVAGKDLSKEIERAYGFEGLGLLAVRGVPSFAEKRQALLPLARKFALLPEEVKKKYEHPESYYRSESTLSSLESSNTANTRSSNSIIITDPFCFAFQPHIFFFFFQNLL
jgi:isopenicillin N synthase-like dioxygenase